MVLSIVSIIICLAALGIMLSSMLKVNYYLGEKTKATKYGLNIRKDFIMMAKDVEEVKNSNYNLYKTSQDLIKVNNILLKENKLMKADILEMKAHITALENDNKMIKSALENHKLISTTSIIDKSFAVKLIK